MCVCVPLSLSLSLSVRDRAESQRTKKQLYRLNTHKEMHTLDSHAVFIPPFFWHPFAQQEFIYSLKAHTKRVRFNIRQKGQGLKHPLGPMCTCACSRYRGSNHKAPEVDCQWRRGSLQNRLSVPDRGWTFKILMFFLFVNKSNALAVYWWSLCCWLAIWFSDLRFCFLTLCCDVHPSAKAQYGLTSWL